MDSVGARSENLNKLVFKSSIYFASKMTLKSCVLVFMFYGKIIVFAKICSFSAIKIFQSVKRCPSFCISVVLNLNAFVLQKTETGTGSVLNI